MAGTMMATSRNCSAKLRLDCASARVVPWLLRSSLSRRVCLRVRSESPIIEEVAGRRISAPVFNRTRWAYHQNSGRYIRHLSSIFKSVTFRNLQGPLSVLTLLSCLVVLYRTLLEQGSLPDVFEGVRFTDVPFQLTSFALSLLLVFRTDASYSRWCAAMDAWGKLRNSASQLVRKAAAWVDNSAALQRLVRWVGAFPLCLMLELRHDQGDPEMEAAIRRELREVLRPHEVEQVVASGPYYHQFCLSVLTALVEAAQLGESREATMLDDLHGFNEAARECEKIMRFPIPLTYTRHTSRFMLIYLAALPLALYDSCDWIAVPVTLVIAFLLLGIEDIGVQIEEPFSILPLPAVCADLRVTAQRAIAQRAMVRCLADPDACKFDPEDLDRNIRKAGDVNNSEALDTITTANVINVGGAGGGESGDGGGGAVSSKPFSTVGIHKGLHAHETGKGLVAAVADSSSSNGSGNSSSSGNGGGTLGGIFPR
ncbi:hypothetical protein Vretimale_9508 [Volvox reticuliferus]|uniref:Uncharacterized protein n=1 Tax=Volvox reticuliferus TaxID=1737510 RepID=A0A8J4GE27_9CHLO|nr:hypothetical protein Vretifemale_18761 [Volvox reticuliferus]GIM05040.1 hypothetical protein Vretimale_9508 [Volvox reticuliferus]